MSEKQELEAAIKIYKITAIIFALLIIMGITYMIVTREKAPEPKPTPTPEVTPEPTPEPTPEATPAPENATTPEPTITPTPTPEANITNQTINATPEPTPTANVTNQTITTPTPQAFSYTWDGINIEFPDTLKRVAVGQTSHHYIAITEADGTPLTNGEQFALKFILDYLYSADTELIPSFEAGKWLITLRPAGIGNVTLKVTIACEDQKGHCQRLYPEGSTEKTTNIEIV
jgi:hypothetical protein